MGVALGDILGTRLGTQLGTKLCTRGHVITNPGTILGSLYHSDFRADDANRVMAGSNVAGLFNYGLDASDALQAVNSSRPAYSAAAFNGGPGIVFDGSDDLLRSVFNTPIPSGPRPYVWIVGAFDASPNNDGVAVSLHDAAPANALSFKYLSGHISVKRLDPTGSEDLQSATGGSGRHLSRVGFSAGGTATLVVDKTDSNNSIRTGAPDQVMTELNLGSVWVGFIAVPQKFTLARVILASDTPSAGMLTAMDDYFYGNNVANYTGSNYGLP